MTFVWESLFAAESRMLLISFASSQQPFVQPFSSCVRFCTVELAAKMFSG